LQGSLFASPFPGNGHLAAPPGVDPVGTMGQLTGGFALWFSAPTGHNNTAGGFNHRFSAPAGHNNTAGGFNHRFSAPAGHNNTAGGFNHRIRYTPLTPRESRRDDTQTTIPLCRPSGTGWCEGCWTHTGGWNHRLYYASPPGI